jgi:hypothetical protein
MRRAWLAVVVAAVTLSGAACSRGPLQVTAIQTGRSLNSDNSVGNHGTRFKPTDTLYVSVLTKGAGSGTLEARWLFRGRVVTEGKKEVSYPDDAATEFHMQYAGTLPTGDYTVEILLDGKAVESRKLEVRP